METWSNGSFSGVIVARLPMIPLEYLQEGFGHLSAPQAGLAYSESLVAAALVMDRLGPRTSMLIWALGSGQTLETALTSLGLSYGDFDGALKRKFTAPTRRD